MSAVEAMPSVCKNGCVRSRIERLRTPRYTGTYAFGKTERGDFYQAQSNHVRVANYGKGFDEIWVLTYCSER